MRILVASALVALFGTLTPASACPDYGNTGKVYNYSGSQLYEAKSFDIEAGGGEDIDRCDINFGSDYGSGYVTETPDFSFKLSGMDKYEIEISVESSCDSVLLINTGEINWFYDDDDGPGTNPIIKLTNPSNGWLDVWVGTHDGDFCPAELTLETF